MAVKKAVQCGNVEDAIEKVNDLNPEVSNDSVSVVHQVTVLLPLPSLKIIIFFC